MQAAIRWTSATEVRSLLRHRREAKGLTRRQAVELAIASGAPPDLDEQRLYDIECRMTGLPDGEILRPLAIALDLSCREILETAGLWW